jgi:energy-coupling factor transporter ATP-binding protein EcfA2
MTQKSKQNKKAAALRRQRTSKNAANAASWIACAQELRKLITRWLPPELLEGVDVRDELKCERRGVLLCGPSGCGKSTFSRTIFGDHVHISEDHIQYTGPCRQRLVDARHDKDLVDDTEDVCGSIASLVARVVDREMVSMGANIVKEVPWGSPARRFFPVTYEVRHVFVFRPFEEAYANVMARHEDDTQTTMILGPTIWPEMKDYLAGHFIRVMMDAALFASQFGNVEFYNLEGNEERRVSVSDVVAEFSRALRTLHSPKIRKLVRVFYNDTDVDNRYTYQRKSTKDDTPKVISAIERAMEGFMNVVVKHVNGNEYEIWTDGPDEFTSDEMRNLAQMGEYTDFTLQMAPGFDFYAS